MQSALAAVRRHFRWAALFSALLNLLFIAPTLYMLQLYDRVVPTSGELTLLFITIVLLFALVTLSLLDYIRSRLLVRASVRLDRSLAGAILDASLAGRGSTRDAMAKQAIREFDVLRQTLTGPAVLGLLDAPWTPIYILVCFLIHPWVGALALAGTAIVLLIAWRNEKATSVPLQRANEAANRSYVTQEQSLASSEVIRALGMRGAMVKRQLTERSSMMQLQAEASFEAGRYATLSRFVRMSLQSLALGLGALLAIDNKISAGAIFAASFLLGRALAPVDQMVGAWRQFTQARGAYKAVSELLESAEMPIALTQLPEPRGQIDVERLVVLAPGKEAPVLNGVSFRMLPGEVVAVIGPSGAGKSTLARALSGGLRADHGTIRIDGAALADWDQERLARFVGYLPQDPSLFAGTVGENISRFTDRLGAGQTDAAVIDAAQACGAHDMILRLTDGYNSMLGWGGRGLSAGQAQRVALARALFGSPPIVILDEPNAHLDSEGEASLVQVLHALKARGAAVLIIAHRMGIMAAVDRILVLNNGKLEAYGPRDEVLKRLTEAQRPAPAPKLNAG
jgi:ATP-binding cassette subfamily C protein